MRDTGSGSADGLHQLAGLARLAYGFVSCGEMLVPTPRTKGQGSQSAEVDYSLLRGHAFPHDESSCGGTAYEINLLFDDLKAYAHEERLGGHADLRVQTGDAETMCVIFQRTIQLSTDTFALPLMMAIEVIDVTVRLQFGETDKLALLFGHEGITDSESFLPFRKTLVLRSPPLDLLWRVECTKDLPCRIAVESPERFFFPQPVPADIHLCWTPLFGYLSLLAGADPAWAAFQNQAVRDR